MNPVLINIIERRSIRAYKPDPVPDDQLSQILFAGQWAPSALGRQTRRMTAIVNDDLRRRLSDAMQALDGKTPDGGAVYGAPVAILVSDRRENLLAAYDCACVMQNLFLAAHSLGFGTCWINQLFQRSQEPTIRPLLREAGIPEDHDVYAVCALGLTAAFTPPKERLDGTVRIVR